MAYNTQYQIVFGPHVLSVERDDENKCFSILNDGVMMSALNDHKHIYFSEDSTYDKWQMYTRSDVGGYVVTTHGTFVHYDTEKDILWQCNEPNLNSLVYSDYVDDDEAPDEISEPKNEPKAKAKAKTVQRTNKTVVKKKVTMNTDDVSL
jgi:hypothetical protein